jgi:hypothetical protein
MCFSGVTETKKILSMIVLVAVVLILILLYLRAPFELAILGRKSGLYVGAYWRYDRLNLRYEVISITGTSVYLKEEKFDIDMGYTTTYYTVDVAELQSLTGDVYNPIPTIPCLVAANLSVGDQVWQYGSTTFGSVVRREYHYYLGYQSLFNVVEMNLAGTLITAHYDIATGVCCYYHIWETNYVYVPSSSNIPEYNVEIILLLMVMMLSITALLKFRGKTLLRVSIVLCSS